jgi:hypothetical protein
VHLPLAVRRRPAPEKRRESSTRTSKASPLDLTVLHQHSEPDPIANNQTFGLSLPPPQEVKLFLSFRFQTDLGKIPKNKKGYSAQKDLDLLQENPSP